MALKVNTNVAIQSYNNPSSTASSSASTSSPSPSPTFTRQNSSQSDSSTLESISSTSSSVPTLTVKFAPLPTLNPRKRRSNQPLGMAARAQLVRRSRRQQQQQRGGGGGGYNDNNDDDGGGGSDSGAELLTWPRMERMRVEALAARHAEVQGRETALEVSRHLEEWHDDDDGGLGGGGGGGDELLDARGRRDDLSDEIIDDPILIIGKLVKVAGKTLWRRMSSKQPPTNHLMKEVELPPGLLAGSRSASPLPILVKTVAVVTHETVDVIDIEEEEVMGEVVVNDHDRDHNEVVVVVVDKEEEEEEEFNKPVVDSSSSEEERVNTILRTSP